MAILITQGTGRLLGVPNLPGFPVDVLAIADPPAHGVHRRVSTAGLGRSFPDDLEAWIEAKVEGLMDDVVARGTVDWMESVAFRLPMQVALHLLSLDPGGYDRVKHLSDEAIDLLAGTTTRWQMARNMFGAMRLYRWCVRAFRGAQRQRPEGLMGALVDAVESGALSDKEASSIVLQILIAGSDSSASLIGSVVGC